MKCTKMMSVQGDGVHSQIVWSALRKKKERKYRTANQCQFETNREASLTTHVELWMMKPKLIFSLQRAFFSLNSIKLWDMLKIFCHKICPTPWRTGSYKTPFVVKLRNSVSSHAEQQWVQACTSPTFHLGLIFGNNLFVLLDFRLRWHVGGESSSCNPRPGVTVSVAATLRSPAFFAVLSG